MMFVKDLFNLDSFVGDRSEQGGAYLGYLLFFLLVGAIVYSASQIFPFFYYYWEIQGLMEAQAAKATVFRDDEIRKNLLKEIKRLELPIEDERDLKINRFSGKIVIELYYEEVFYFDLGKDRSYDLWVFKFNPRAERVL